MAENSIKVEIAPNGTVHVTPKEPFTSANFTEQQTYELIMALQEALDHLRHSEFMRSVSMHFWYSTKTS